MLFFLFTCSRLTIQSPLSTSGYGGVVQSEVIIAIGTLYFHGLHLISWPRGLRKSLFSFNCTGALYLAVGSCDNEYPLKVKGPCYWVYI